MQLESLLILHRFICREFYFDNIRRMLDELNSVADAGNVNTFLDALNKHFEGRAWRVDQETMARYDDNINAVSDALRINTPQRRWKPYQYAALLLTERYLHLYFEDAEALCKQLNAFKEEHRQWSDIEDYRESDLRTLAFQSATGSGKTLLLQANILQYHHYAREYRQAGRLNKIILLTPNEQMSRQHEQELTASGIAARLFDGTNSGLFTGDIVVDIIDIHKLSHRAGVKTVAVEAFEENNLVMVDEGHLGTTGTKWRDLRRRLVKNGFCFEYSATFNQAVAGSNRKDLREAYGKCLLFDYSYRHFYGDGYGKDYKISNLRQNDDRYVSDLYLTACLLTFYQQRRLYEDSNAEWREYNLATPLWVFLGKTVSSAGHRDTMTDVERIIVFFARVLTQRKETEKHIRKLLDNDSGLISAGGSDLFANAFPVLKGKNPDDLYDDLCRLVFRGSGQLRVAHLPKGDELHLSAGDNQPFGVINVGNAAGLYKLFKENDDRPFMLSKDNFSPPLFDSIDADDSPINIAIGARRFVAGWNSWRVSTMGLMHVGGGEGPQIIQMFGRGVRLKGKGMSLKRHTAPGRESDEKARNGNLLKLLETLNVFGLRANYMEKFQQYVQAEIPEVLTLFVPVTKNFGEGHDLKILRLKAETKYAFSGDELELPADESITVTVDRYPQLQSLASADEHGNAEKNTEKFNAVHCSLMNRQRIYFRVLKYKEEKGWHNLHIPVSTVETLIQREGWYTLEIPPAKMALDDFAKVADWEGIMAELIAEYAGRFWQINRGNWENKRIDLEVLPDDDKNYPDGDRYQITVDAKEQELIQAIEAMNKVIDKRKFYEMWKGLPLEPLMVDRHAYKPLFWKSGGSSVATVTPAPLNDDEKRLVERVDSVARMDVAFKGIGIYLMRNRSRGRGVSLFVDYHFYPDFILWMKQGKKQHIVFIDPKGLVRFNHIVKKKTDLHRDIKKIQTRIRKKDRTVFLHSYIWTTTKLEDIGSDEPMTEDKCRRDGIYLAWRSGLDVPDMLKHALTNTAPAPKD